MTFWRPPGSILEAPGLDFKGFWDQFFEYFRRRPVRKCFLPQVRFSSKVWANCSQIVGFPFPMCLQQCSPADASLKGMAVPQHSCSQMGRRRWPPPGGVQWNWSQVGSSWPSNCDLGALLGALGPILVPKRSQNGSQGTKRRLQERIFTRFLVDFNAYNANIYHQKTRY